MVWGYNPMANAEVFGCQLIVHMADNSDIDKEESELYTLIMNEKTELYSALDDSIAKIYLSFDNKISESNSETELLNIAKPTLFAMRAVDGFTATGAVCSRNIMGANINFTPGTYRKYGVSSSCYQWATGDYTISKCSGGPLYRAPLSQLMLYYSCSNYDVYRVN